MNHIIRYLWASVLLVSLLGSVPVAFGDSKGGTGTTSPTPPPTTSTTASR
jgi:hypothetical protein